MKVEKRLIAFVFLSLIVVSFLSVSVVSAGWWSDFFGRITGRAITGSDPAQYTIYSLLGEMKNGGSGCKIVLPASYRYNSADPNMNQLISSVANFASYFKISESIFDDELVGNEKCLIYLRQRDVDISMPNPMRLDLAESSDKVVLHIVYPGDSDYQMLLTLLKNYTSLSSQLNYPSVDVSFWGDVISPHEFGCSDELNKDGAVYSLDRDYIYHSSHPSCFEISGDNIILEGNGHKLTQEFPNFVPAISVTGNNVTVKNLTIIGFTSGISSSGLNNEISDIKFDYSGSFGIISSGGSLNVRNYDNLRGFSFSNTLLSFENQYGKVEFEASPTLPISSSDLKISDAVKISQFADVEINTSLFPDLNKPAVLRFYNLNLSFPISVLYKDGLEVSGDYWTDLGTDSDSDGVYDEPFSVRVVGFDDYCVSDDQCGQSVCRDNLCVPYYIGGYHNGNQMIFIEENYTYNGKNVYKEKNGGRFLYHFGYSSGCCINSCLGICTPDTGRSCNGNGSTFEGWYGPVRVWRGLFS